MQLTPLLPELYPTTATIGFVEASVEETARSIAAWWRGPSAISEITGDDLRSSLAHLRPVDAGHTRFLIVPTSGSWTAWFDNGPHGTDASTFGTHLVRSLQTRAARVTCTGNETRDSYPARIVEVYDYREEPHCTRRSIAAMNDGGRWVFDQFGKPFSFESADWYAAKAKRDRFPLEAMIEFLGELDLHPFDPHFYDPAAGCRLVLHQTFDEVSNHPER